MNASFMRYRREHRHAVKGTEASPDSFHSHDPSPEKFFYLQEAVELALRAMSDSYRGVFLLRYRDGYSTLETSLISELPIGTVKAITHRARMKAISALAKKPDDSGALLSKLAEKLSRTYLE
jgi:DNA-directed RNA polymerase specialized sigma24 family protein